MNVLTALKEVQTVFPEKITNEFINSMPRRELSEEERSKPYAKYYFKDMAPIPQEDLDIVNAGAIDPAKALRIQDCARMLDEGYLDTETGFCVMPDGSGFAATKVFMPNVTPEMIDWWFNWHPLEDLRYAIWCPVAHDAISSSDSEGQLDSSGVPLHVRNIGKTHYPVEGFDLKGKQTVEIEFRKPEVIGISQEQMDNSCVKAFVIGTCTSQSFHAPINVLFHSVREVPGGIEYRSRYWLKYMIQNGRPALAKFPPLSKKQMYYMARSNCIHSLTEYNNLASILPQLYSEMGGRIE